jgi:hypothetical protein
MFICQKGKILPAQFRLSTRQPRKHHYNKRRRTVLLKKVT